MSILLLGKDKGSACEENPPLQTFSYFGTSMLSPKVVNRWLIHALCWPFLGSAKYILVNLAFLIKGKLLRELKFTPTPCGNLNKVLLSSASTA